MQSQNYIIQRQKDDFSVSVASYSFLSEKANFFLNFLPIPLYKYDLFYHTFYMIVTKINIKVFVYYYWFCFDGTRE